MDYVTEPDAASQTAYTRFVGDPPFAGFRPPPNLPPLGGGARFPPLAGFKGGQDIRANAASTSLGRPSVRLSSPLSRARERGRG